MALDFVPTGEAVVLGTMNFPLAFTVMGWAKLDVTGADRVILSKSSGSASSSQVLTIRANTDNAIKTFVNTSTALGQVLGNIVTLGVWFHWAVTLGGSNIRLYQVGAEVNSIANTGTLDQTGDTVRIGSQGHSATSRNWDGTIDDVSVYDRALSATEILAAAKHRGRQILEGRVHYWSLQEGASGTSPGATAIKDAHNAQDSTAIDGTPTYESSPGTKPSPMVTL